MASELHTLSHMNRRLLSTSMLLGLALALGGCAAPAEDDEPSSNGAAVSSESCPSPFQGHDTPETAILLGHLVDNGGHDELVAGGSLRVGQTVFYKVTTRDATNLADPFLQASAKSLYRMEKDELGTPYGYSDGLDWEARYTCNSGETELTCHAGVGTLPARGGACTFDEDKDFATHLRLKPHCSGTLDESGTLLLRVTRRAPPSATAEGLEGDFYGKLVVPIACGLMQVRVRNVFDR